MLRFGELTLDLASREAHRGDRAFVLTRIESPVLLQRVIADLGLRMTTQQLADLRTTRSTRVDEAM